MVWVLLLKVNCLAFCDSRGEAVGKECEAVDKAWWCVFPEVGAQGLLMGY